jgi:DNA-binding CsgD family transcriptional regulator
MLNPARLGSRRIMTQSRAENAEKAPFGLTPRELEVLRHVADGRAIGEVAELLGITSRTAEIHTRVIVVKFGAAVYRRLLPSPSAKA